MVRWDVFYYDSSCGNYSAISNGNSGENLYVAAYPYIVSDNNRMLFFFICINKLIKFVLFDKTEHMSPVCGKKSRVGRHKRACRMDTLNYIYMGCDACKTPDFSVRKIGVCTYIASIPQCAGKSDIFTDEVISLKMGTPGDVMT